MEKEPRLGSGGCCCCPHIRRFLPVTLHWTVVEKLMAQTIGRYRGVAGAAVERAPSPGATGSTWCGSVTRPRGHDAVVSSKFLEEDGIAGSCNG